MAGLNHKMGNRGTVNTLLSFGEQDDCHGYLVGEPHHGLAYMFHMMNEARVAVGRGAGTCGLAGYLYSLEYAKQRPQGRKLTDRDPTSEPVMIIEHADVKRLLMTQKAFVEGAQHLVLYCSKLIDLQKVCESKEEKQQLDLLLEVLTPIAKSWPSEFCLEANKLAIQVLGGYGYTREYPVERHYRDNRLNPIHEGSHGIQGLDLLGRKVMMFDGAALKILLSEMEKTSTQTRNDSELAPFSDKLDESIAKIKRSTYAVASCENKELALANATIYLDAVGHIVIAWMWLQQAAVASKKLTDENSGRSDFYRGKLKACRFFYHYELPKALEQLSLIERLDDTCFNTQVSEF